MAVYAATLTSPADGASLDPRQMQRFQWNHNSDDGKAPSAYNVRWRLNGTVAWNETGWVAGVYTHHDFKAGTFANQSRYEWQAATKDSTGTAGPFSASRFFDAYHVPDAPPITSPTNNSVIYDQFADVQWTVSQQDAYQVKVEDGPGVVYYDSGTVGGVAGSTARTHRVPLSTSDVTRILLVRYQWNGLWSPYSKVTVQVDFDSPAKPGVTITVGSPNPAAIKVKGEHPAPVGAQPTVAASRVRARKVGQTGIGRRVLYAHKPKTVDGPPAGEFVDWTPPSTTDLEYMVEAVGSNGVIQESDWTPVTVAPTGGTGPTAIPAAPADIFLFANPTSIDGFWDEVAQATAYDAQYKPTSGTVWTDLLINSANRSFVRTGLTPQTSYDVQVRAQNSLGESAWTVRSITTPAEVVQPTPSQLLTAAETNPSTDASAWKGIRGTVGRSNATGDVTIGTYAWTLTPDGSGTAQMTRSALAEIALPSDAAELTFVARDVKSKGASIGWSLAVEWYTGTPEAPVYHSRNTATAVTVTGTMQTLTYVVPRPSWDVTSCEVFVVSATTPAAADVLVVNEFDLDVTATGTPPTEPGTGAVLWQPDLAAGTALDVFKYEVATGIANTSFPLDSTSTDPSGRTYRVNVPTGAAEGAKLRTRFRDIGLSERSEVYFSVEMFFPSSMNLGSSTSKQSWGVAGLPDAQGGWYTSAGGVKKADSWSARWTHLPPDYLAWKYGTHPMTLNLYLYATHAGGQTLTEYGIEVPFRTGLNGASGTWYDLSANLDRWIPITGYVKMNTAGTNDGVARAWIGDQLWVDLTDVRWNETGTPTITQIISETFFNNPITPGGAIQYRNLTLQGTSVYNQRPYSTSSEWNRTLADLGLTAVHPDSALIIDSIKTDTDDTGADTAFVHTSLSSDPDQYTYPVYIIDAATPVRRVFVSNVMSWGQDPNGDVFRPGSGTLGSDPAAQHMELWIPVPDDAAPSVGTDKQTILVDPSRGVEYGFWRFQDNGNGTYSAQNAYRYRLHWDGKPKNITAHQWNLADNGVTKTYAAGDPPGFYLLSGGTSPTQTYNNGVWMSRGHGGTYLAGLMRPWEIEAGVIKHAIAFAYDWPSEEFVSPATKSDGLGKTKAEVAAGAKYDMPEGARLRLKSTIDINAKYTDPVARIMAQALRDYGAIAVDNAGRPKIYPEDNLTAKWGTKVTDSTAAQISLDDLEVIDWTAAPTTSTQAYLGFSDAFTGGTFSAAWTTKSTAITVNASDQAVIPTTTGFPRLQTGAYDLTGKATHVQVISATQASGTLHEFIVQIDTQNLYEWLITNGTLRVRKVVANVYTTLLNITYDALAHKWLRIREDGGQIIFETSADKSLWTNRHSEVPSIALTAVAVKLMSGNSTTSSGEFVVDNVNV